MTMFQEPERGSGKRKLSGYDKFPKEPDLFDAGLLPETPYHENTLYSVVRSTAGHSGTATSEARAIEEVINGELTKRQLKALSHLAAVGFIGLTWKEFDYVSQLNHAGKSSSVLSVLHQTNRIVRLSEVRDGCLVYVLPEFVSGRAETPFNRGYCVCGKSLKKSYNYCPHCGTAKLT